MKFKSILFTLLFLLFATPSLFAAQATLSWNPNSESDLAGYKVYYGNSSGTYHTSVDAGNQTSYTVPNLKEGDPYFFAVTAYDLSGNESGYSNEVSYDVPIPPDTTPPADPTGTGVTGPDTITWNQNTESDLKGYLVYRDGKLFAKPIEAYVVIKGRNKHKDWKDYYVKAYDTNGNLSGQGNTITIKFRGNRIIQA